MPQSETLDRDGIARSRSKVKNNYNNNYSIYEFKLRGCIASQYGGKRNYAPLKRGVQSKEKEFLAKTPKYKVSSWSILTSANQRVI